MTSLLGVVYDCNVLLLALISPRGPARALVEAVHEKRVVLYLSQFFLDELHDAALRPRIARKFSLTEKRVADFIAALHQLSRQLTIVPHVFDMARDPDDARYVDLAVAAGAKLIISRDNDLLSLGDPSTAGGKGFAARFPELSILTPPQLLERLRR